MDQLKENIDAFEIEWDDELEAAVNKIHREILHQLHRKGNQNGNSNFCSRMLLGG